MRLTAIQLAIAAILITVFTGCKSGVSLPKWDWWRKTDVAPPPSSLSGTPLPSQTAQTSLPGSGNGSTMPPSFGSSLPAYSATPPYGTNSPYGTTPGTPYGGASGYSSTSPNPSSVAATGGYAGSSTYPSTGYPSYGSTAGSTTYPAYTSPSVAQQVPGPASSNAGNGGIAAQVGPYAGGQPAGASAAYPNPSYAGSAATKPSVASSMGYTTPNVAVTTPSATGDYSSSGSSGNVGPRYASTLGTTPGTTRYDSGSAGGPAYIAPTTQSPSSTAPPSYIPGNTGYTPGATGYNPPGVPSYTVPKYDPLGSASGSSLPTPATFRPGSVTGYAQPTAGGLAPSNAAGQTVAPAVYPNTGM